MLVTLSVITFTEITWNVPLHWWTDAPPTVARAWKHMLGLTIVVHFIQKHHYNVSVTFLLTFLVNKSSLLKVYCPLYSTVPPTTWSYRNPHSYITNKIVLHEIIASFIFFLFLHSYWFKVQLFSKDSQVASHNNPNASTASMLIKYES